MHHDPLPAPSVPEQQVSNRAAAGRDVTVTRTDGTQLRCPAPKLQGGPGGGDWRYRERPGPGRRYGSGMLELKMSSEYFHVPSGCRFRISRYLPTSTSASGPAITMR